MGSQIDSLREDFAMLYIGIDLGTSAIKILLVNGEGEIVNTVTKEYPLYFPHPGWAEQNPENWWNACMEGLSELLEGFDKLSVNGIGIGGQMHGLVILDDKDRVIRPAILWNDGRTAEETDWLNTEIGKEKLSSLTGNIAFAGFTAPKLLWMKRNEPENFARIRRIMLPKDFLNYRLTGIHACDYSDAAGMLLLDVARRRWSAEMLEICGVTEEQMPKLFESYEVIGTLKPEIATGLGISESVKVAAGAGDNAAAAIGTGTVGDGACNISIGTSGTIFFSEDSFRDNSDNALHSFAHADGRYHLMGCMLSAASCNKWFCDEILKTQDYDSEQLNISEEQLGKNPVFFLPYLMGERSPINDVDARACFIGMSMDTTRADLLQAVFEGVAFGIRDSFEAAKALGLHISDSMLCGGGAKSPLWRKILVNVLNIRLMIPLTEEGPGYGAAMLAMVSCGLYGSVKDCVDALVQVTDVISPDPALAKRYEEQYQKFRIIYPALKSVFPELL